MIGKSSLLVRQIVRNAFVRAAHDHGGVPGANLPFDINNRFKLTAIMIAFFGSAFGAPFLIVRYQLTKLL
ncbi:cytochrome c oxidase subunit 7C, mitochondrial-like [Diorhabda sublineata]|uniref:cytochrome c oxidase subunit 7C, mitochondrial-like n=1 Tax=Diorhabda sublineata TaxID=1163346 RepID=UPI0024E11E27|nr:cytochrome c oxidase subunit 7C, mitochondrial-like [Diorhabda sublineata]